MPRTTARRDLAQLLAPVSLPEADGQVVNLGQLWQAQTLVLVHLRHFG